MSNLETTRVMGAPATETDRTLVVPGGMGATMQMPGQGDALRTQMGGTTTCPVCKSTTPVMEAFCGDCGFLLTSTPVESAAPPPEEAPAAELVDSQNGRRYRLRNGVNTLGRQGTDILVNEGTVSRNHANITIENGTITIEDLGSSNGTKVGDQRIGANSPTQAAPGTPLRFGNWNVVLEIPGGGTAPVNAAATIVMPAAGIVPSNDSAAPSSAFVDEDTFVAGAASPAASPPVTSPSTKDSISGGALVATLRKIEGVADDIAITEGVITIGRRPENTVVLSGDAYVSGRHAEIVTDSTGTYLTDVGSTNGTVLNGQKLAPNERQLLMEGDELQIGQSKFRSESVRETDPESSMQEALPVDQDNISADDSDASVGSPWRQE